MSAELGPPRRGPVPGDPLAQLVLERRSYIIGTLVVWAVILVTWIVLFASMEPQLLSAPPGTSLHDAMARMVQPTAQQQWILYLAWMVGAVALFFLNWRFSLLIQRPRGAFALPGKSAGRRWLWWAVLSLNSMFYVSLLVPQLVVTWVLARWGSQEIARRGAPAAPPPNL